MYYFYILFEYYFYKNHAIHSFVFLKKNLFYTYIDLFFDIHIIILSLHSADISPKNINFF